MKRALGIFFALHYFASVAIAALPPTTIKGQSDSSKTTTFDFQVPHNQVTKTSGTAALIETGNGNLLKNPGFEATTYNTGWTASGGTVAAAAGTNIGFSKGLTWDASSAGQTLRSDAITVPEYLKGQPLEAFCRIKTPSGTATHTIGIYNGSSQLVTTTIPSQTSFVPARPGSIQAPSSGTIQLELKAVAADEPLIAIDDCYLGPDRNIGSVQQTTMYATVKFPGSACSFAETTSTAENDFVTLGTGGGGCNQTAAIEGSATQVATNRHEITLPNLPEGKYKVTLTGFFYNSSNVQICNFRFTDGSSGFGYNTVYGGASGTASGAIIGTITYSGSGSRTFAVQAGDSHAGQCSIENNGSGRPMAWTIERFPSASETIYRANTFPWKVDAAIGGYFTDLGFLSRSTLTDLTGADYTLSAASGSQPVGVACPSGTASTVGATTCPASESLGITFNPPGGYSGDVYACASFTHTAGATARGAGGSFSVISSFKIVTTPSSSTTVLQESKDASVTRLSLEANHPQHYSGFPHRVCGIFTLDGSQTTFRLMNKQSVSYDTATGVSNTITADGASSNFDRFVHFEVFPLTQGVPAPLMIGPNEMTKTVSSTATLAPSDTNVFATSASSYTITLPSAVTAGAGKVLTITKTDSGTGLITVAPSGSETIGGRSSTLIHGQNESIQLVSDGANWQWKSSGYRTESLKSVCSPASSIGAQTGNWVSSIANQAGGYCNVVIRSGVFSAAPNCTITFEQNSTNTPLIGHIKNVAATSLDYNGLYFSSGSSTVFTVNGNAAWLVCNGPR